VEGPCRRGVVSGTLVASILTVVPAMGLLFYLLRRYEGYFEQARFFFALVTGLFLGTLLRAFETLYIQFETPGTAQVLGWEVSLAYTVAGYAMLAAASMAAVAGLRRFRTRKDTPYYGAALGTAFGAMYAMPMFAFTMQDYILATPGLAGQVALSLVALLFVAGLVLAHAAAGIWVGRGSAAGLLWRGLAHGTLWLMPAMAVLWLWVQNRQRPGIAPAVALFIYGAVAAVLAQRKVLDPIVPPEVRDQLRKAQRREMRRKA
jgi:hypothetical protein